MNVEHALITKLAKSKSLRVARRLGVQPDTFLDDDAREWFRWLTAMSKRTKSVPSLALLQEEFPDFEPEVSKDSARLLGEMVLSQKLYADMDTRMREVQREARGDPREALALWRKYATEMTMAHTSASDVDMSKSRKSMLREYKQIKTAGGLFGIPWKWDALTKATRGKRKGQYILLYARKKSLKTYLALADADYTHRLGYTVIFFTRELTPGQVRTRVALIRARVNVKAYFDGTLTKEETRRFHEALQELENGAITVRLCGKVWEIRYKKSAPWMVCPVKGKGEEAIAEMRAKCEEYRVKIAYADSLQFMAASFGWEDQADFHASLKTDIAMPETGLNIPVVGIAHAKSSAKHTGGKDDDEVKFTDVAGDILDYLIRIVRNPIHRDNEEAEMVVPFGRDGGDDTHLVVHAKLCEDMGQKYAGEWQDPEGADNAFEETE